MRVSPRIQRQSRLYKRLVSAAATRALMVDIVMSEALKRKSDPSSLPMNNDYADFKSIVHTRQGRTRLGNCDLRFISLMPSEATIYR